ncbi:PKD domain-containing protein [Vibrio sp. CAU 1672]|uniref:PKD domain-containing protein n=1 Tax=Vibrio sp. CAU 1672 TaxID=3032594 RepID=UPI0023DB2057|nr:PKD domain-containing protein [Vibrio sp. CAU 1672]MDF2152779.1 PKD domain-containing protein [Vibrio sp. CAU 1672]
MKWAKYLILLLAIPLAACDNNNHLKTSTSSPERPIANAGDSVQLKQGATAILNGSKSYDPDGASLTYQWTITSAPSGSGSQLVNSTSAFPSLYLDVVGDYDVQLIVNNGSEDSLPSTLRISDTDSIPVANAGPDQKHNGTDSVRLDGSHSYDGDGDPLSYQWTVVSSPSGSKVTLARADSAFPVFTPDLAGDYEFELIVDDGVNLSAADRVLVTDQNAKPVASAGNDQAYTLGDTVTLIGNRSTDLDGDTLTYDWHVVSAPSGSSASIAATSSAITSFTPDVSGDYVIALIVNDGQLSSDASTISLRETTHRPVANAGLDISVVVGQSVQLDGSASSDLDGDKLTPTWSITSKPKNSNTVLTDVHTMHPSLTPDVDGQYVVALTVSDGSQSSLVDSVTVSTQNLPPIADAGKPLQLTAGQVAHLNGSASSDPEGDSLSYAWSILSAPASSSAALSSATVVAPNFTPDVEGTYVFQLVVNDGSLSSAPSTVVVTDTDLPPVAHAGNDQSVTNGVLVTVDGTQSFDPELQPLSYAWSMLSQPSSSSASLSNASTAVATFTTDVAGDYLLQLTVTDAGGQSNTDTVLIRDTATNTMPVADAGRDLQVDMGTSTVLDGSGSSDADGDKLTYSWAMMSRPAGSSAQLNDASSPTPSFTPDVEGDFVFQLVVSDGQSTSLPDVIMVHDTERNLAPTAVITFTGSPDFKTGTLITLQSDSSSDPNGDTLTYYWSLLQASGSSAVLSDSNSANPTFTADVAGSYVAVLTVNDGTLSSDVVVRSINITDPPKGAAIPLPAGQNLMFLSNSGGDSRTGAIYGVPETDLVNITELLSFHGVPAFNWSFPRQGLATHPTDGHVYGLVSNAGLYGAGVITRFNPETNEVTVFTDIPRFYRSGHYIRDLRRALVFHPDGKSMYTYSEKGGYNDVGLVLHINTDPISPDYRKVSVIAEIGKPATNYNGSTTTLLPDLEWTEDGSLIGLFGFSRTGNSKPALKFSPSDPNDLSQPWNTGTLVNSIYSRAKTFYFKDNFLLSITSVSPPVLTGMGEDGLGGGETLPDCFDPFGIFEWDSPNVYILCNASANGNYPLLYKSNSIGANPTLVRSMSNIPKIEITGVATSTRTSTAYMSVNDESMSFFLDFPGDLSSFGLSQPRLFEVTKPNYSTQAVIVGNDERGSFFLGDPAIVNDPSDSLNDRYVSVLSYNGGSLDVGAILTYDRGDGSIDVASFGFERGGYPYGRIHETAHGDYYFSVAAYQNYNDTGATLIYDSSAGELTAVNASREIRPAIGLEADDTGILYGQGIELFPSRYVVYSINPSDASFAKVSELSLTSDTFPQYEVSVDQNNLWVLTETDLYCRDGSSGATGKHTFQTNADHNPVRKVTFTSPGDVGYVLMRASATANQGSIMQVTNNCAIPQASTVVSGLTDIPSTAMIKASDGMFYYGTENGKLMKFNATTSGVTTVATLTDMKIVGFLMEDANGDIIGAAEATNGGNDKMFAYTIASGMVSTADIPEDRPLDHVYPGFTEIN